MNCPGIEFLPSPDKYRYLPTDKGLFPWSCHFVLGQHLHPSKDYDCCDLLSAHHTRAELAEFVLGAGRSAAVLGHAISAPAGERA